MKKPLFFCLLLTTLLCCEEDLRFAQTQPAGIPALSSIPPKLHGTYIDADSTFVVIDAHSITERKILEIDEPLDSLWASILTEGDLIISDSSANGFRVTDPKEGVEIFLTVSQGNASGTLHWEEPLFQQSENGVVKSWQGRYYFNHLRSMDTGWILRKVVLKRDSLHMSKIDKPKTDSLRLITPVDVHIQKDGDEVGVMINPSQEELATLFKKYEERTRSLKKLN